jgi:hypothetical protein
MRCTRPERARMPVFYHVVIPGVGPLVLPSEEITGMLVRGVPALAARRVNLKGYERPASASGWSTLKEESSQVSNGPRCEPEEGESRPKCCYVMPPKHYSNPTLRRCGNCGKKEPGSSCAKPMKKYANTELLAPPEQ